MRRWREVIAWRHERRCGQADLARSWYAYVSATWPETAEALEADSRRLRLG